MVVHINWSNPIVLISVACQSQNASTGRVSFGDDNIYPRIAPTGAREELQDCVFKRCKDLCHLELNTNTHLRNKKYEGEPA